MAPSLSFLPILFCFLLAKTSDADISCSPSDRAALLAFRSALNSSVFSTWTGKNCCSDWYGIVCNTAGRVDRIILDGDVKFESNPTGLMSGTISSKICRLDQLTSIELINWKEISGPIPTCITSLSLLTSIDFSGNKISGPIPSDIGKLTNVGYLNLASNRITGQIPASLPSALWHFDLRENLISGEIPATFVNHRKLINVFLSQNKISGEIPSSIASLSKLRVLLLSENRLVGRIPSGLRGLTLQLGSNRITGPIPADLIRNNGGSLNLSRNAISGFIPDVFPPHIYIALLDLSYNRLVGPLPKTLTSASMVEVLDLSHNQLCGPIPAESPFKDFPASSFDKNKCLCGNPLPKPCS